MNQSDFESVTLGTVAEGHLEQLFQDRLAEVSQVFEESVEEGKYETSKDGTVEVKIQLEVSLSRKRDESVIGVGVRSALKKPKERGVERTAFYVDGGFTASRFKQADLIPRRRKAEPTPLRHVAPTSEE